MNLKKVALIIFLTSILFIAAVALMAIWDIFDNDEFVWKALMSLAVIAFSGLIGIVIGDKMEKDQIS